MLIASLIIAGAIGAPSRYLLDGWIQARAHGVFPWGTFAVNATGSLLLGLVTGLVLYHGLGDVPRVAIGAGFCGAYTTFSTFSYETVRLVEEGSLSEAGLNAIGSVATGLLAAAIGLTIMAAL